MTPQFKAAVETYGPRFMADLGLTVPHVAGMFGNFAVETGEFTALQEHNPRAGSRGGWGWPQWSGVRREQFEAWAKQHGYALDDPEGFYGFILHELRGSEKSALAALKRTTSVDTATESFMKRYERPGTPHLDRRKAAGREALALLESRTTDAPKLAKSTTRQVRSKRGVVDPDWMPDASMQRIVVHWTAGGHKASALDRDHYHILIEGDGTLVRGKPSISANVPPLRAGYAAHTLNCNGNAIGVSLCCMAGATEQPFDAGSAPMTRVQWDALPAVLADLCERYDIPVTPKNVLSHAEVQATLSIRQRGKWDIARLAFDPSVVGARACGDLFREATCRALGRSAVASRPVGKIAPAPQPELAILRAPAVETVPAPTRAEVKADLPFWARWFAPKARTPAVDRPGLKPGGDPVLYDVQVQLRDRAYYTRWKPDGFDGPVTRDAVAAARKDAGLGDGGIDDAFRAALPALGNRQVPVEKATASLREAAALRPELFSPTKWLATAGLGSLGLGTADGTGLLDQLQDTTARVGEVTGSVQSAIATVSGVVGFIAEHRSIVLILIGGLVLLQAVRYALDAWIKVRQAFF